MSKINELLKSEIPTYTTNLPTDGKEIKFRPFRVKEEKVLLMAVEEGTENGMIQSMINIVESCCDNIKNAGNLVSVDLEWLFLQLRIKSIGETVEPLITCPFTDEKFQAEINLSDVEVVKKEDLSNKIKITDNIGITLKHPTMNTIFKNDFPDFSDMGIESALKIIALSIEEIWTDSEIFKNDELTLEDKLEFIEGMLPEKFESLVEFFENSPTLQYELKYKTKDGEERELVMKGIADFFG